MFHLKNVQWWQRIYLIAEPRVAITKRYKSPSLIILYLISILCLPLTTCRYVRRPEEDHDIEGRDASLVKSRQEGGFEEVNFVVNSFVKLAGLLKDL